MSDVISSVPAAKYANARQSSSRTSTARVGAPLWRATKSTVSAKAVPQAYMASPAIAGLPRRLVQRVEVRHDPTAASAAAATAAASEPYSSNNRKITSSAPVI